MYQVIVDSNFHVIVVCVHCVTTYDSSGAMSIIQVAVCINCFNKTAVNVFNDLASVGVEVPSVWHEYIVTFVTGMTFEMWTISDCTVVVVQVIGLQLVHLRPIEHNCID